MEREEGVFRLRRFEMEKAARVVIIEVIVTTGLSIRETFESLRALGAEVLAEYEVPAYPADKLPPELAAIPAFKPGSRNL